MSTEDGSNGPVSETALDMPSSTVVVAFSVAVGATLLTTRLVVYSVKPPSLSMIRALTGKLPLSLDEQLVEADVPEPA